MFIIGVNALVAGGWVGILVSPGGDTLAVMLGVLAGLGYVVAFLVAGYRLYSKYEATTGAVRFPGNVDGVS